MNIDYWWRVDDRFANLTHSSLVELWKSNVEWLDRTLSKVEGKVIVVTHYLPTRKLIVGKFNRKEYEIGNTGYYSNLDWMIEKYNDKIEYWFCGHSHVTSLTTIGNTVLYLNPLGAPHEESETILYTGILTIL
jgi:hypothetical protein